MISMQIPECKELEDLALKKRLSSLWSSGSNLWSSGSFELSRVSCVHGSGSFDFLSLPLDEGSLHEVKEEFQQEDEKDVIEQEIFVEKLFCPSPPLFPESTSEEDNDGFLDDESCAQSSVELSTDDLNQHSNSPLDEDDGDVELDCADDEIISAFIGVNVKPNARRRMQDLQKLFWKLHKRKVIQLISHEEVNQNCVLGFSEILVDDLGEFNSSIRNLVLKDESHCWLMNGRESIKEPTWPVYEILRQIGIKPVKGMRGPKHGDPGKRDFMYYTKYEFCRELMLKNRCRLQAGFIGRGRRNYF